MWASPKPGEDKSIRDARVDTADSDEGAGEWAPPKARENNKRDGEWASPKAHENKSLRDVRVHTADSDEGAGLHCPPRHVTPE